MQTCGQLWVLHHKSLTSQVISQLLQLYTCMWLKYKIYIQLFKYSVLNILTIVCVADPHFPTRVCHTRLPLLKVQVHSEKSGFKTERAVLGLTSQLPIFPPHSQAHCTWTYMHAHTQYTPPQHTHHNILGRTSTTHTKMYMWAHINMCIYNVHVCACWAHVGIDLHLHCTTMKRIERPWKVACTISTNLRRGE